MAAEERKVRHGRTATDGKRITAEEHKTRHKELRKYLDELVADFAYHTKNSLTKATVMDLMEWSDLQALKPNEFEE